MLRRALRIPEHPNHLVILQVNNPFFYNLHELQRQIQKVLESHAFKLTKRNETKLSSMKSTSSSFGVLNFINFSNVIFEGIIDSF